MDENKKQQVRTQRYQRPARTFRMPARGRHSKFYHRALNVITTAVLVFAVASIMWGYAVVYQVGYQAGTSCMEQQ